MTEFQKLLNKYGRALACAEILEGQGQDPAHHQQLAEQTEAKIIALHEKARLEAGHELLDKLAEHEISLWKDNGMVTFKSDLSDPIAVALEKRKPDNLTLFEHVGWKG